VELSPGKEAMEHIDNGRRSRAEEERIWYWLPLLLLE
jgi:hypothetical protein